MQMIRVFLVLLCIGASANALGQVQSAKGRATVTYASVVTPEVKTQALQNAQFKALEMHYAEAGEAESENFDNIRPLVAANPDRFILNTVILNEEDRPDLHQYSVTVRVDLNAAQLRNAVKGGSSVANAAKSDKSTLTFLFVSRQVDAVKTYDAHVYERVDKTGTANAEATTAEKGTEGESIGKSQISTNASKSSKSVGSAHVSATTERGGSTTQKADVTTWRLFPSANLSSVFRGIFTNAGFKVVDAAYVEPRSHGKLSVQAVEDDYQIGKDLKSITLQNMVAGLKNAQVPYLAFGTLDVGVTGTDPATGLMRVAVTANAKILDVSGEFPEDAATVGPVQYAGIGPTEDEARTNALKLAATSAARELVSQVTNKGIH
jgi:hypothetical protein